MCSLKYQGRFSSVSWKRGGCRNQHFCCLFASVGPVICGTPLQVFLVLLSAQWKHLYSHLCHFPIKSSAHMNRLPPCTKLVYVGVGKEMKREGICWIESPFKAICALLQISEITCIYLALCLALGGEDVKTIKTLSPFRNLESNWQQQKHIYAH